MSNTTTDHETIKRWAQERDAHPAQVKGTSGSDDTGVLRFDFEEPGKGPEERLEEISWDQFFDKFDAAGLALLYQEKTKDGAMSRFFKLVSRETANVR